MLLCAARVGNRYCSDTTTKVTTIHESQSSIAKALTAHDAMSTQRRFKRFELNGRVYVVTGGAGGLGVGIVKAIIEAGGKVHVLDWAAEPLADFHVMKEEKQQQEDLMAHIAAKHQRVDGLVAAAAVQNVKDALDWTEEETMHMLAVNVGGVSFSAIAAARQMEKYGCPGSIILIASMSALISNIGLKCHMYNASKAAVVQLGRSFAMELGQRINGMPVRVNSLCPGNILTPMLRKNFEDDPPLRAKMESLNLFGRISGVEEHVGPALLMLSDAGSFMTGTSVVVNGGYTAV
ncbi:oxidoreductase [Teratosphaeria nubilosa]|uniref:Oxidoreductase n=1 Tax=Teratosphaeria nubilosa TaxID=161662 RepID=A0A6G1L9T6_9PEZI|nr:oxidoreductase [Teratosphaeria nubilosa]